MMYEMMENLQTTTATNVRKVGEQIQAYGKQIGDYLKSIDADVRDYRFAVEKTENGLTIDVAFKASIKSSRDTAA